MIFWIIIFIVFLIIYFLVLFVDFRKRTPPINVSEPITSSLLPTVISNPSYIQCGDPWGNVLPGFWYDIKEDQTLSIIPTNSLPSATISPTQPLYPYGKGKRSCFPVTNT